MTAKNENKWYILGTASAKIMNTDINMKQIRKRKIIKIDLRSTRTFVTTSSSYTITYKLTWQERKVLQEVIVNDLKLRSWELIEMPHCYTRIQTFKYTDEPKAFRHDKTTIKVIWLYTNTDYIFWHCPGIYDTCFSNNKYNTFVIYIYFILVNNGTFIVTTRWLSANRVAILCVKLWQHRNTHVLVKSILICTNFIFRYCF